MQHSSRYADLSFPIAAISGFRRSNQNRQPLQLHEQEPYSGRSKRTDLFNFRLLRGPAANRSRQHLYLEWAPIKPLLRKRRAVPTRTRVSVDISGTRTFTENGVEPRKFCTLGL